MLKSVLSLIKTSTRTRAPKVFLAKAVKFSTTPSSVSDQNPKFPSLFKTRFVEEDDAENLDIRLSDDLTLLPLLIDSLKQTFRERTLIQAITIMPKISRLHSENKDQNEKYFNEIVEILEKNLDLLEKPNSFIVILRSSVVNEYFSSELSEKIFRQAIKVFLEKYAVNESGNLITYFFSKLQEKNKEFPPELIGLLSKHSKKISLSHTVELLIHLSMQKVADPQVYRNLVENLKIARIAITGEELFSLIYLWNVGQILGEQVMSAETCDILLDLSNKATENIQKRIPINKRSYIAAQIMLAAARKIDTQNSSRLTELEKNLQNLNTKEDISNIDSNEDLARYYLSILTSLADKTNKINLKLDLESINM